MFNDGCRAYASLNIIHYPFSFLHGDSRLKCGCFIKHYPFSFLHGDSRSLHGASRFFHGDSRFKISVNVGIEKKFNRFVWSSR